MLSYLRVHEDERQLGHQLAAERSEIQFHLHAVAHHDAECIALLRVQQPGGTEGVLDYTSTVTRRVSWMD